MITAVIILAVVALALGGYIAFDIVRGKKKAAAADPVKQDKSQTTKEQAAPAANEEIAAVDEP